MIVFLLKLLFLNQLRTALVNNRHISSVSSLHVSSVANDAETFQVNSLIKEIAKARGCSASQLLIAYNLNQGMACIPKSSNPIRMEENYKVQ